MIEHTNKLIAELQEAFCGLLVTRILIDPDHWAFDMINELKDFSTFNRESQILIVKVTDTLFEVINNPYPTKINHEKVLIEKMDEWWKGHFTQLPETVFTEQTYGELIATLKYNSDQRA